MATFALNGLWLDDERILFETASLSTLEGLETPTWNVRLDGVHDLPRANDERVRLRFVTSEGRTLEGLALVSGYAHHDETSKLYYGVVFTGLTTLRQIATV